MQIKFESQTPFEDSNTDISNHGSAMSNNRTAVSIQTIFFRNMILIALVSVTLWSAIWILFECSAFVSESDSLRKKYVETQKILLKTEVTNLLSYIKEMRKQTQNTIRMNLPYMEEMLSRYNVILEYEQQEILNRIVYLRFGREGYFFGSTDKGEPLFSNGEITIGTKSVWNLTDPDGVKIIQEQHKAAQKQEGDFVHYRWKKLDSEFPSPKLSFVMAIPEWNWTVGAGLYLDTIETTINEKRGALKKDLLNKIIASIFILSALCLLIFYWARHIAAHLHKSISTFSTFFQQAATNLVTIKPEMLHFRELQEIAEGANRMIIDQKLAIQEKMKLQQKLRQSHKMEAIGTLAGGIAHDINNILSVIIGNVELAIYDTNEINPLFKNLDAIRTSSLNAKNIVRQLLSFSRQTDEEKITLNLNMLVKESLILLRTSIPSSISIKTDLTSEDSFINANSTQIHQVLLNLCSNAAHAMEAKGGLLEIATRVVAISDSDSGKVEERIMLSVKDQGHGMVPEIIEKIFDPYFTTKTIGKGTGMGLSVVHGIIQNHGGNISVSSSPENGTTFEILFPVVRNTSINTDKLPKRELPRGKGNILVVDDDESLVNMQKEFFERLGYKVTVSTKPVDALALFTATPQFFQLVITDMTMPVMNGEELIRRILSIRPDMPIVLCTGYHDKINGQTANETRATICFTKPIDSFEFARAIGDILSTQQPVNL